jgi:hypothetical protein
MPRVKSIPHHQEVYILKRIQQLCPDIIRIIYAFTNKRVKLIYNPKWDWYLNTINFEYYNLINFNYKIKQFLHYFNHAKMCIFYNKLTEKYPKLVKDMRESGEIELWNLSFLKDRISCYINEFIELTMKEYNRYRKNILFSSCEENVRIVQFKKDQENNNYNEMPEIENIVFLCKSILYLHSKIIQK